MQCATRDILWVSRLLQLAMKYLALILKASAAVEQRMRAWIFPNGSSKGFQNKRILVTFTDGISNDAPVTEIKDGTEIYFVRFYSLIPFEFRNICTPFLIWLVRMKISIQKIFSQELSLLCMAGTSTGSIFNSGLNAPGLTDSPDAFIVYLNSIIVFQLIIDSPDSLCEWSRSIPPACCFLFPVRCV